MNRICFAAALVFMVLAGVSPSLTSHVLPVAAETAAAVVAAIAFLAIGTLLGDGNQPMAWKSAIGIALAIGVAVVILFLTLDPARCGPTGC